MTPELSYVLLGTGTVLALITAIGAQNAFVLRQALTGRHIVPIIAFCIVADALLYALGVGGMGFLVQRLPWVITALRWGGVAFLVGYGLMAARRAIRPTGEALVVTEADAVGPDAVLPDAEDGIARETAAGSGSAAEGGATGSRTQTPVPVTGATACSHAPEEGSGGLAATTATLPQVAPPAPRTSPEHTPGPASAVRTRRGGLAAALLTCAAMTFLNPHTYLDTVVLVGSVANQQGAEGQWWFWIGATLGSALWFMALGFGARLLRPLFARAVTWRVLDAGIAVLMWSIAWHLVHG